MEPDVPGPTPGEAPSPRLGARVVIRSRLPAPDPGTGATLTDAVGTLIASDDDRMTLTTRRGEVTVARTDVVAVKEVPPAPRRRGAPHRALSVEQLQRVMVGAWPAAQTERLGEWLLRAAGGFTHRANSAMTAGEPGVPLADAVTDVESWYAARELASMLTVAVPVGAEPEGTPLGTELLRRGYAARQPTLTLTAAARDVAAAAGGSSSAEVSTTTDLTDAWLQAYGAYRAVDEQAARRILTGSPEQVFASVLVNGEVAAVGRLGVSASWGGVAAMWARPDLRGRGLGAQVLTTLAAEATARGIRPLHLQVDADNEPALALYARYGFEPHHLYTTFRAPGA
ncbi:MAG: GNAT family N-acetyltransferase [Phycicoccus sp.]